jgi:surface carbohydrate biosynthesis protein
MGKKILILSASPQRDFIIDALISEELKALGNDVWVRPCMREGRKSILELTPDIVVLPPIKQPYSRDMCETIKRFGCGLVVRHTEASCDWSDWKKMTPYQKQEIMGGFPYVCDVELLWSEDEAQILSQRRSPFPVVPVGAFGMDIYFRDDKASRFPPRQAFNEKWKLDQNKKTLLITCAWGFADTAPDLQVDEMRAFGKDEAGRNKHIAMIKVLKEKLPDWNILLTLHPGVTIEPYKQAFPDMSIDTESPATELLLNCDALVHSGSTMGIEMHLLNKPAFMFNDQNAVRSSSWFDSADCDINKVSPRFDNPEELAAAISVAELKSNGNLEAIDSLTKGRYGKMDGLASKRAADIINQINGKFTYAWPRSINDYSQPDCVRKLETLAVQVGCGICGDSYWLKPDKKDNMWCPWCGARTFKMETA